MGIRGGPTLWILSAEWRIKKLWKMALAINSMTMAMTLLHGDVSKDNEAHDVNVALWTWSGSELD